MDTSGGTSRSWYSAEELRMWRLVHWYARLNLHEPFRDAVQALLEELESITPGGHRFNPPYRGPWWAAQSYSDESLERWVEATTGSPDESHYRQALRIRRAVTSFGAEWPIPPDRLWEDVSHTYWLYSFNRERGRSVAPGLQVGGFAYGEPTPGHEVVVGEEVREGVRWRFIDHLPVIFPSHPLPIPYDPLRQSRAELREVLEELLHQIQESVLAQADAFEQQVKEAGWGPRPPRVSHEELEKNADILFRHLILRQPWKNIARKYDISMSTAVERARTFQEQLGLPPQ